MSNHCDYLMRDTHRAVIQHLINKLEHQGLKPVMHFELEGMYRTKNNALIDFSPINKALKGLGILGTLKKEYWPFQWEFVSDFVGQSPLTEADSLAQAMLHIPKLFAVQGAERVFLSPVVWQATKAKYLPESSVLFGNNNGMVHVPNAIQINISLLNADKQNLMADSTLGEWVQFHLLQQSLRCCLLFLPENDAFRRLQLRSLFGLDAELSSPFELSGGHQGSIALYREKGKHNQPMGQEPLLVNAKSEVIAYKHDWRKTSRVEHRLGATSTLYDPYVNTIFILLAVLDAVRDWQQFPTEPASFEDCQLPTTLTSGAGQSGAIELFEQEEWFATQIDHYCQDLAGEKNHSIGNRVKQHYLRMIKQHAKNNHSQQELWK